VSYIDTCWKRREGPGRTPASFSLALPDFPLDFFNAGLKLSPRKKRMEEMTKIRAFQERQNP
jgi:hypothetical protein